MITASLGPLKNGGCKEDDPASYWVSGTFQGRAVKLRGYTLAIDFDASTGFFPHSGDVFFGVGVGVVIRKKLCF